MQPVIPNATFLKAENPESTQYAATINGKSYSGISTERTVTPAHQKTVRVKKHREEPEVYTDLEGNEQTRMIQVEYYEDQVVDVPEQTKWHSRFGPAVQKAIDEGAVVEPYVAPPAPDPDLEQIRNIMTRQAMIIHDVFKQLKADGYLDVQGVHMTQQTRDDFQNLMAFVANYRSNQ